MIFFTNRELSNGFPLLSSSPSNSFSVAEYHRLGKLSEWRGGSDRKGAGLENCIPAPNGMDKEDAALTCGRNSLHLVETQRTGSVHVYLR